MKKLLFLILYGVAVWFPQFQVAAAEPAPASEPVAVNEAPAIVAPATNASTSVASASATPASATPASEALAFSSDSVSAKTANQALEEAAREQKFLYLVVREAPNEASEAAQKKVEDTVQKLATRTTSFVMDRTQETEKAIVEKFNLKNAPMPIALVIAPNGAVTNGFVGDMITPEKLEEALVSTGYQRIIKAMQDRKLILLGVQNSSTTANAAAMVGVNEFKADPRFGKDVEVIQIDPADAREEKLLTQLKINPKTTEAITALLAPPGTVLGTFPGATTKAQIESTLMSAMNSGCGTSGCGTSGCGS
jgi:hypothetical protein